MNQNYTIWANALLSNGKLLFYYTGRNDSSKCEVYDFYKDFYYAGINMSEYMNTHKLKVERMGFVITDEEYNNYVFNVFATKFYQMFECSPDCKHKPEPVVF